MAHALRDISLFNLLQITRLRPPDIDRLLQRRERLDSRRRSSGFFTSRALVSGV